MKKIIVILSAILFIGFQAKAQQYLHWIQWVNEPNHVATASELGDIAYALNAGSINPKNTYRLSTGVLYRIPKPNMYLEYLVKVYQKIDPSTTASNLYLKIKNDDETNWDNNLNMTVKNYYFSSVHHEVRFISNYSGVSTQCPVLLHNGYPTIKRDCGNPLESYGTVGLETTTAPAQVATENKYIPVENYNPVLPQQKYTFTNPVLPQQKVKHKKWWILPLVAVVVGTGTYIALTGGKSTASGNPGGAPSTTGNNDPRGPGGAPSTTGVHGFRPSIVGFRISF
ncbi:MAG: hypothetical protein KGI58_00305 [Patescibacteria group bacterium]|nr:hypothetical protein [Patescibacteria group bacterium]